MPWLSVMPVNIRFRQLTREARSGLAPALLGTEVSEPQPHGPQIHPRGSSVAWDGAAQHEGLDQEL